MTWLRTATLYLIQDIAIGVEAFEVKCKRQTLTKIPPPRTPGSMNKHHRGSEVNVKQIRGRKGLAEGTPARGEAYTVLSLSGGT